MLAASTESPSDTQSAEMKPQETGNFSTCKILKQRAIKTEKEMWLLKKRYWQNRSYLFVPSRARSRCCTKARFVCISVSCATCSVPMFVVRRRLFHSVCQEIPAYCSLSFSWGSSGGHCVY